METSRKDLAFIIRSVVNLPSDIEKEILEKERQQQDRPLDEHDLFEAAKEWGDDRRHFQRRVARLQQYMHDYGGVISETTRYRHIEYFLRKQKREEEEQARQQQHEMQLRQLKMERTYQNQQSNASVKDQIKDIRRLLAAFTATEESVTVVSYTDYYEEKVRFDRVEGHLWSPPQAEFPRMMIDLDSIPSDQEDHAKAFWKELLQKGQLVEGVNNAYRKGFLGSNKPDVQFFPTHVQQQQQTPQAHDFLAIGDCKGPDWKVTEKGARGQVMKYLKRILDAQPTRMTAYGFLTNNDTFLLVKASRSTKEEKYMIVWDFSSALNFKDGLASFLHLLKEDSYNYAMPPEVGGSIAYIQRPLRPGGSCRTFLAKWKEESVVLKLYETERDAKKNADRLKAAEEIQEAEGTVIAKLKGQSGKWLITGPFGNRIEKGALTHDILEKLVLLLKNVHTAGQVHWDVRFANILIQDGGTEVVLIDWGSSGERESGKARIEGCPPPWRHPDLESASWSPRLPKHDLYSLVLSSAELIMPGISRRGHQKYFAEALDAAEAVDYDRLIQEFRNIDIGE